MMGYAAIANIALKGLVAIQAALSSDNIKGAGIIIDAVKGIVEKPEGEVSTHEYERTDRLLDEQLAEFNKPI